MNTFKIVPLLWLAFCGGIGASEFGYSYTIEEKILKTANLTYKNINFSKNNGPIQPAANITLFWRTQDSEVTLLGTNLVHLSVFIDKTDNPPLTHSDKSIIEYSEQVKPRKLELLSNTNKAVYDWGVKIAHKKFGIQIVPRIEQPWYKRYLGYILGTLGICIGTYCYVKYAQKSTK